MISHHLTLLIAGKTRPLTIAADHVVNTPEGLLFYDENETLIATVPTEIIIEHTQS